MSYLTMRSLLSKTRPTASRFYSTASSHVFELAESNFATHNCPALPTSTTLTRDDGLALYKTMVTVRRLETAADQVCLCTVFLLFLQLI